MTEAYGGGMAVEDSHQCSIKFCSMQQMAAEKQSDEMASHMEVQMKYRCGIGFLQVEINGTH